MAGVRIPIFERGSVLTYDMLEQLKVYLMQISSVEYLDFSDGIICGCRITMSDGIIYLGSGLVAFNDNLIVISEDMQLQVEPSNELQILVLNIGNKYREMNFEVIDVQLECTKESDISSNKLELCRFRLQHGASLRNQYKDFFDMGTEYDTIDETYARWASVSGDTLSARVLNGFANGMLKLNTKNQYDIDFIGKLLTLDGHSMNRQAILYYLSNRLERPYREMSPHDMYLGLCEVIKRQSGSSVVRNAPREKRRIIVD